MNKKSATHGYSDKKKKPRSKKKRKQKKADKKNSILQATYLGSDTN